MNSLYFDFKNRANEFLQVQYPCSVSDLFDYFTFDPYNMQLLNEQSKLELTIGSYFSQINNTFEVFGHENVLVLFQEEMALDISVIVNKITDFLHIKYISRERVSDNYGFILFVFSYIFNTFVYVLRFFYYKVFNLLPWSYIDLDRNYNEKLKEIKFYSRKMGELYSVLDKYYSSSNQKLFQLLNDKNSFNVWKFK